MSFADLPSHMMGRREKLFGYGRPIPLDRNAKARITVLATFRRKIDEGSCWGRIAAFGEICNVGRIWGLTALILADSFM